MQAHVNASTNCDEFVMESLITYDKLGLLVHELLAAEAWSDSVYPLLKGKLTQKSSLRAYFIVSFILLPALEHLVGFGLIVSECFYRQYKQSPSHRPFNLRV